MTFVDTGFLFALVSSKDEHHARVVEVLQTFRSVNLRDYLVTTNHVVAETITLTRKIGHEAASRLGDRLYGEKLAAIHWTTPDEERAAFDPSAITFYSPPSCHARHARADASESDDTPDIDSWRPPDPDSAAGSDPESRWTSVSSLWLSISCQSGSRNVVRPARIELAAPRLGGGCSIP